MLILIIISDMFFTVTLIWSSINKNKWRSWRCLKILDLGWRWFLARIISTICAGRIILALCWQHSGKIQWQSIKLVLLTMHSCHMPPKRRLQTNTFHISMTRFWWQGQSTMYHGQDFMNHIVFWSMSLSILMYPCSGVWRKRRTLLMWPYHARSLSIKLTKWSSAPAVHTSENYWR